jgi:hypothetical protein
VTISQIGVPVHYVELSGVKKTCRAAAITAAGSAPQTVSLFVMEPATTAFVASSDRYDGNPPAPGAVTGLCGGLDYLAGTWHHPV